MRKYIAIFILFASCENSFNKKMNHCIEQFKYYQTKIDSLKNLPPTYVRDSIRNNYLDSQIFYQEEGSCIYLKQELTK